MAPLMVEQHCCSTEVEVATDAEQVFDFHFACDYLLKLERQK